MPDKKPTDNEIKKALECCCGIEHDCDKCPYEENNECGELNGILKDALDLINRLQAENERLKKANEMFADIGKMYSEIKSEAHQEFAERLKTEYAKGMNWFKKKESYYVDVGDIDNLLKELVGEDNA